MLNEQEVMRVAGREAIQSFLQSRRCFELIRPSGKVVVFETKIPIQFAFYALLEHEMMAAPLWDSQRREFAGLMTITDFVDVLRYYHDAHGQCGAAIEVLASRSLAQILDDAGSGPHFKHATEHTRTTREESSLTTEEQRQRNSNRGPLAETYGSLVAVDADASLFAACSLMRSKRRRFLPVVAPDDCGVLAVVTHVDILRYFVEHFRDERRLFDAPLSDLGIGTFQDLAVVTRNTPLRDVLELLADRDLSSVPVVDDAGKVSALYARNDITFLAAATDADSVVANLAAVVGDLLAQRRHDEPVHTCPARASLQFVFQLFAQVKFKRLIFIDEHEKPVGIVSPRDLLAYFL